MQYEHLDLLRRSAEVPKPSGMRRFFEAVLALSDDPRPESVERYLIASRALEDSRSKNVAPESRGLTKGRI